ncbi:hypothetical protein LCGC14_2871460 [marine sediment metagenome]|uniref:Uncharacterized protein n=1 Tax=marine sediment metagenome TaxID=412755 RepID=A0A0F8YPI5_9ZZZZ
MGKIFGFIVFGFSLVAFVIGFFALINVFIEPRNVWDLAPIGHALGSIGFFMSGFVLFLMADLLLDGSLSGFPYEPNKGGFD